jgi:hypothetical protein
VDSELKLIRKRRRLEDAQEEIRVRKRALWRKRDELLAIRRQEDIDHALEIEAIDDLEEKLCAEFGTEASM